MPLSTACVFNCQLYNKLPGAPAVNCCCPAAAVMLLDVVRSWSDLGGPTVLMMLAHLATTQPHCTTMPLKSLQVPRRVGVGVGWRDAVPLCVSVADVGHIHACVSAAALWCWFGGDDAHALVRAVAVAHPVVCFSNY